MIKNILYVWITVRCMQKEQCRYVPVTNA